MQAQVLTLACHKSSILPHFFSKKLAYSGNLSSHERFINIYCLKTIGMIVIFELLISMTDLNTFNFE
jgi:hypothetical protein